MKPLVSVVMTAYNQEPYVAQAIESVLAQRECDFEIIIGEDCSTDGTAEIAQRYAREYPDKITVTNRGKNLGQKLNLKDCFERCRGDFVAFCESDDYWIDPLKLKKQAALLAKGGHTMCFSDIKLLMTDGTIREHIPNKYEIIPDIFSIRECISPMNPMGHFSSGMYRMDAVRRMPASYYEDQRNADWLFNLYILDQGDGVFLKEVCGIYRIIPTGVWSGKTHEEQIATIRNACARYDELFNYRYTAEFMKLRDSVSV
jgi:glycosyltransferase involved in cell wall biosynthesis